MLNVVTAPTAKYAREVSDIADITALETFFEIATDIVASAQANGETLELEPEPSFTTTALSSHPYAKVPLAI
jgi:hypothetical protein